MPYLDQIKHRFTDQFLEKKRMRGDEAADTVIESIAIRLGNEEAKKIFKILISNIGIPFSALPEEVEVFFKDNSSFPEWANPAKIERAENFFIDHGPKFLLFLYFKSLPILYCCHDGAKVLASAGRLTHKDSNVQFSRRIAETGQFLIDVMTPGNLAAGKPAVETAVKIRLIHASVRFFLKQSGWDIQQHGEPINQEHMAITLMTFSFAMIEALNDIGLRETDATKNSYIHHWNVVGHLLGINTDLIPTNHHEAEFVLHRIFNHQKAYSEDGKLLAKALIKFAEENIPGQVLDDAPEMLIHSLAGREVAETLHIREPKGCLSRILPAVLLNIYKEGEKLEGRKKKLKSHIDRISVALVKSMINYFRMYKNEPLQIPDAMKEKWGIL